MLLQHFSWHSVFWINVPALCLTMAAGAVPIPESRNPAAPPLDIPGVLLPAGAVTCLVWGVIDGPEHGWTAATTWMLLTGSAVLLTAYTRALQPALGTLPAAYAATARASITQAAQLASRLPAGGPALRAAAGSAFLHGMSIVMLICAAITALAALASLRSLPGRATPSPARQPPVTASPPAGTRR